MFVAHRFVDVINLAECLAKLGVELSAYLYKGRPREVVALRKDTADQSIAATQLLLGNSNFLASSLPTAYA